MDTLDLSDFFKTKAEAQQFAEQISNIGERIYQTGFDLNRILTEQFGIQKKEKFITLMRDNSVATESNANIKDFFAKIIDKCSNLVTLAITLAFEPNPETLNILSEWCILNLGKQVVFDVKVDPTLVAGATIFYNGKYFTFSVKQTFDNIVNQILSSEFSNSTTQNNQTNIPIAQIEDHNIVKYE